MSVLEVEIEELQDELRKLKIENERVKTHLQDAAKFYCRWYDSGDPMEMSGSNVAYQLYVLISHALADDTPNEVER